MDWSFRIRFSSRNDVTEQAWVVVNGTWPRWEGKVVHSLTVKGDILYTILTPKESKHGVPMCSDLNAWAIPSRRLTKVRIVGLANKDHTNVSVSQPQNTIADPLVAVTKGMISTRYHHLDPPLPDLPDWVHVKASIVRDGQGNPVKDKFDRVTFVAIAFEPGEHIGQDGWERDFLFRDDDDVGSFIDQATRANYLGRISIGGPRDKVVDLNVEMIH